MPLNLDNVPVLPAYRCFKIVYAAKILDVTPPADVTSAATLTLLGYGDIGVAGPWFTKHDPKRGGYFVRYEDGYDSYSPAEAFESGYRLLPPRPIIESPEPMLQWFVYAHLPAHLQAVSAPFCDLAHQIVSDLPRNAERTVALRKLLEAKDCAVRSLIYKG